MKTLQMILLLINRALKMGRIHSKAFLGASLVLQQNLRKQSLALHRYYSCFLSHRLLIMPTSQGTEMSEPSPKKFRAELSTGSEGGCGANSPSGLDAQVRLQFAKLTPNAFTPTRGSALAAGFDLHR